MQFSARSGPGVGSFYNGFDRRAESARRAVQGTPSSPGPPASLYAPHPSHRVIPTTTDSPRDSAAPAAAPGTPASLDAPCLRQALHDLRGPLNNATILLEIVKTVGNKDADLARTKLTQSIHELHRIARMLDQLALASDGVTTEPVAQDAAPLLVAAANALPKASRVEVVAGDGAPFDRAAPVLANAADLGRLLRLVLERCASALPDGGTIRVDRDERASLVRLTFTGHGPRVERPTLSHPRLTDGTRPADDWFGCWALVRRVRGDLHVDHGNDVGIRIAIDLARASPRT